MSFPSKNPTTTRAWAKLEAHYKTLEKQHLATLFKNDPKRAEKLSIAWENFYLDYSKNRINPDTLDLLLQLAEEVGLQDAIKQQFSGAAINATENRAVGHTELRNFNALKPEVQEVLEKMEAFSNKITNKEWLGFTGKPITSIVNIGIGGSDLGPALVCDALQYYRNTLDVQFISNVEGDHVQEILKRLDPETTLFIVVSKSFSTQETLTNANTVRKWFLQHANKEAIASHFVAVSTNIEAVQDFGVNPTHIFPMWDWVGGRFSLWSAVGLSIACAIGFSNFKELLAGAHAMDKHFKTAPFNLNMPVVLGMLSVWYNNFFNAETEAVIPYSQYLSKLVDYLQQAVMESNGKSVGRDGKKVNYSTGTIVWGSTGTNAQHAFFQLMHQGTRLIPADFIAFAQSLHPNQGHQDALLANFLAQTEALALGTYGQDVLTPFRMFEGNKPSNTLLIERLTPYTLGALLALYEHKLFVQGVVWNIYSYDQWGVELGKVLATKTLQALQTKNTDGIANVSTKTLLKKL